MPSGFFINQGKKLALIIDIVLSLVREASSVEMRFRVFPHTIENSLIGVHINMTRIVYLIRRKGLPCLKEKINDTLDLSSNRRFSDAVNELKPLGVV